MSVSSLRPLEISPPRLRSRPTPVRLRGPVRSRGRRRAGRALAAAGLALALASVSGIGAARAAEADSPDAPHMWFGAFWGVELRGGFAVRGADASFDPTPALGLGLRAATLMTLIDAELAVDTLGLTREAGRRDAERHAAAHDLRLTSVALELRLHPLFMRYIQGDALAASLHLALGAGVDVLSVAGPLQDATHAALGLRVGLGLEVPLTDPQARGWSLWLGLAWRMSFAGFSDAPAGLRDQDRQEGLLSLSLRWHDIGFMRLPHPTELRDDDGR